MNNLIKYYGIYNLEQAIDYNTLWSELTWDEQSQFFYYLVRIGPIPNPRSNISKIAELKKWRYQNQTRKVVFIL
jgi:hypothetical protein